MRRKVLVPVLAALLVPGAVAVAQIRGDDGREIAESASSFGECVSQAGQAGIEDPDRYCREQGFAPPGEDGGGENGDGRRGGGEREVSGGEFGRCVERNAREGAEDPTEGCGDPGHSAFGRCVAANAQAGSENPTEGCPHPGRGNGDDQVGEGSRGVQGPPATVPTGPPAGAPRGQPSGTPSGPPAGATQGQPDGTPSGRPAGAPQGPPAGTPQGGSSGPARAGEAAASTGSSNGAGRPGGSARP